MHPLLKQHIERTIAQSLPPEAEHIFSDLLVEQVFHKGDCLAEEGKPCLSIYFITQGAACAYFLDAKGEKNAMQLALEGHWISDLSSFFSGQAALYTIEALEPLKVVVLKKENFAKASQAFPFFDRLFRILIQNAYVSLQQRLAKTNAEQNLKNVKELFESYLQGVFDNKGEGWEEKILGDVCSLYQGIAINAKTKHALVEKSDLPLLRIKDLKNNTVEQYIDPNNFPVNSLVNEEDIIYTRTGSLGLVFRGKKGVLHNNSFKVVPTSELTKDYLFIWLQNPNFKAKIMGLAMKAAQPDITHAIFKIQEIAIPPLKEQDNIVKNLDVLSAETKKLEGIYNQKINDLEELKKSVLQKAFSGELKTAKVLAI